MTREEFSLGRWVKQSIDLGAIEKRKTIHLLFRGVYFTRQKDRDAFLELSIESYPFETFVRDTLDGMYIIQHKPLES